MNISLLLKNLHEKPIAFYGYYADLTGSVTAGLFFSQCMYWYATMKKKEFYKTDKEFMKETRLSIRELVSAKKRLQELGLITITRKGIPAKSYYTIHEDRLIELLTMPLVDNSVEKTVDNYDDTHLRPIESTLPPVTTKRNNKLRQNVITRYDETSQLDTTKRNNYYRDYTEIKKDINIGNVLNSARETPAIQEKNDFSKTAKQPISNCQQMLDRYNKPIVVETKKPEVEIHTEIPLDEIPTNHLQSDQERRAQDIETVNVCGKEAIASLVGKSYQTKATHKGYYDRGYREVEDTRYLKLHDHLSGRLKY